MQRRSLLKLGAIGAGATLARSLGAQALATAAPHIRQVLLVTKCHLDVGFTQTQQKVMQKYFQVYYPEAMRTAATLRAQGADRYTWTTGSWLLYEYLEQAGAAERRRMEEAIAAGDIAWHALPFSWQTEMLTRSLIEGALALSATLDRRFGRKTIGAKMTDVPGHSRGIIAPLHAAGIRLLDVGVNAASTPPDVPDLFLWKDADNNSLAMMYHRHDYGSVLPIPGSDVAVAVEVRNDNGGPHTLEEIAAMYKKLRAQFPGAQVRPATFSDVAAAVDKVRDSLPVLHSEIGDTWIYGVASDPLKVAQFREAARAREQWIAAHRFVSGDSTDRQLLRRLLLAAEHTWGTDTKSYVDNDHYRPADLERVLTSPPYQTMENSWQEKRDDIHQAVASLPAPLQDEMKQRFERLLPRRPDTAGLTPHPAEQPLTTTHFELVISASGAIVGLKHRKSGRDWASPEHPLVLFTYQTLSAADFDDFLARYITVKTDWAPRDFGKPNIDHFGALSKEWHPRLTSCMYGKNESGEHLLLECVIDDEAAAQTGNVAWPTAIVCELHCPASEERIDITVSTFGKRASRMPEAMWLTFHPHTRADGSWSVTKVSEEVDLTDVVRGGGRSMHGIFDRLQYREQQRPALTIHAPDTPLLAVSGRSPLNYSPAPPDLGNGMHFGLFNNAWGTNYIQWIGGDWQFRFSLSMP